MEHLQNDPTTILENLWDYTEVPFFGSFRGSGSGFGVLVCWACALQLGPSGQTVARFLRPCSLRFQRKSFRR